MKNQVMVWLAGASLHDQGRAPFRRKELIEEVKRLFPTANDLTVSQYVTFGVNVSGSLPHSFSYIIRTSPGTYRLTRPTDDKIHGKPRWPEQEDVDPLFLPLWRRWVAWQKGVPQEVTAAALQTDSVEEKEEDEDSSVHYTQSAYREAMLEHLLVGELMRQLWPAPLEVCKPLVDGTGYDLLLQCDGVMRYVQLKTSKVDASVSSVNVHVDLWERPGSCVIWTRFDPETVDLREFWWIGEPSQPLPPQDELKVAKHTKGNAQGVKLPRPSLRVVPKSRFKRLTSIRELLQHLFGVPNPD